MFQHDLIPLHLTSDKEVKWKNLSTNSADSLRPVFLIHEKENDQELLNLVIPQIMLEQTQLKVAEILIIKTKVYIYTLTQKMQ